MNRFAAWAFDALERLLSGCITASLQADFDDPSPAVEPAGQDPGNGPESPMMRRVNGERRRLLIEMESKVAATKPRAAAWVGLVCDEWTMTFETEGGQKVQSVDPCTQWRYLYRGTHIECLN